DWRVVKYRCPYLRREVWEIWAGPVPCIPANIYLREQSQLHGWRSTTIEAKAYRLVNFFRALGQAGISFWTDSVRRGGNLMLAYRVSLQRRLQSAPTTQEEEDDEAENALFATGDALARITESRASDIMGEILDL